MLRPYSARSLIRPLTLVRILGRRKSNQVNSSYLQPKTDNFSVRPLSLIHVHVLRVDHIARLLLLRAARAGGRTPARSGPQTPPPPPRPPPPHRPVLPLASSCTAPLRSCAASARRFPSPPAAA